MFTFCRKELRHDRIRPQPIDRQITKTPSLQKALEFLRLRGIQDLPDGRVEIDGQKVYAIARRYETTDTGPPKFEYHKKYIDIQFIATKRVPVHHAEYKLPI